MGIEQPAVAAIDSDHGHRHGGGQPGETLITLRPRERLRIATIKVIQPVLSIVADTDSFDLPLTTSSNASRYSWWVRVAWH